MSDADARDRVLVMPWIHRRMLLEDAVVALVTTTSLWVGFAVACHTDQPSGLRTWLLPCALLTILFPFLFSILWIAFDIFFQIMKIVSKELDARTGPRKWFSFHLSTLVWMSLVGSVLMGANIRERACSLAFHGSDNWHPYEEISGAANAKGQGWPYVFRIVTASGVAQCNPCILASNSLCFAGLGLVLAFCAEYRARYRKPPRQPP